MTGLSLREALSASLIVESIDPDYAAALVLVTDAARQHVTSLEIAGRLEGLADKYREAIRVVEAGMPAAERGRAA